MKRDLDDSHSDEFARRPSPPGSQRTGRENTREDKEGRTEHSS